ncbi:MAG: M28 family peptidase [Flavobacteriales bacterium]|nr:M28 family peptidase [Flavobacteriales bacterium]
MWLCASLLRAQPDTVASRFARLIDRVDLQRQLEVLANDSFMGRDTGKEGQRMAAEYLRDRFLEIGVPPLSRAGVDRGFFQTYELIESRKGSIAVRSSDHELKWPQEVLYFSEHMNEGLELDWLVPLKATKPLDSLSVARAGAVIDARSLELGPAGFNGLREPLERAKTAGFKAVFIIVQEESKQQMDGFVHADGTSMRLPSPEDRPQTRNGTMQVFYLTAPGLSKLSGRRGMRSLLGAKGRRVKVGISIEVTPREKRVQAENVLAYIEGTDLREELVVVTAHYDHIGVENDVVYNGADDDGSGTVALLEIAQAFTAARAAGRGPRRSILVMPVSGEEKGLLGSRYYSENPVFPLEQTVSNLNIDMIGRVDSAHAASPPYVYIIGSDRLSSELHAVNEEANSAQTGIVLDYSFNAEDDPNRFYYRSDHYNFARKGVPSIFYFSGVHEDYHQPGDDVEKIRFDLLEARARLVFHTAWLLANRNERIRADKPIR